MTPALGGGLALGSAVAAVCKVAEGGEVAEGRALVCPFLQPRQARGHGGLDWGGWWPWDEGQNTGVENLPEAL